MRSKIQNYRWSYLRKLREIFNNGDVIVSPINAIRTMKIIELTNICEIISRLKKDNNLNDLYEELREILHNNINLILKASTICPGVNTTSLNCMTVELLKDELNEEETTILSSNRVYVENDQRVVKQKKK